MFSHTDEKKHYTGHPIDGYDEKEPAQQPIAGKENTMIENNGGGYSFSTVAEYYDTTDGKHKTDIACKLIRQIFIFGTVLQNINANEKKISDTTKTFLSTLICDGYGKNIIDDFNEVYGKSLTPQMSKPLYILAYMTSLSKTDTNSHNTMKFLRGEAYKSVSLIRIGSHLLEWVSSHIELSTADPKCGKGTGTGFRKAITEWFFKYNNNPQQLALQVMKYNNRNKFTFRDICRMVHPKTTSIRRCKCKGLYECKCQPQNPDTFNDLCSLGVQVVIGYLTRGLKHSFTLLHQGISRAKYQEKECTQGIINALYTLAFLSAVEKTKNDGTGIDTVVELIRSFSLPWELINNHIVQRPEIQYVLTVGTGKDNQGYKHHVVNQIIERNNEFKMDNNIIIPYIQLIQSTDTDEKEHNNIPLKVIKSITALYRQLNQLDNLCNNHPRKQMILELICNHIQNKNVLMKGYIHPLNVLNTVMTYRSGKGLRGSSTWNVNSHIVNALYKAFDVSFSTVKGYGRSFAKLVDCSGSMTWDGSVSGLPALRANNVVAALLACMMRAEKRLAEEKKTFVPPHLVGFFGNTRSVYNYGNTCTEAERKSQAFKEITDKITTEMNLEEIESVFSRSDWGSTDIASGLYYLILKLEKIVKALRNNDIKYRGMSPFELFFEVIYVLTDNDVNSGDQPMIVLEKYRNLVGELFRLLPYDKDGKRQDPEVLKQYYKPKMIVLATQGTDVTIGDPRDPYVLTVSGFDLSFPDIIDNFLKQ